MSSPGKTILAVLAAALVAAGATAQPAPRALAGPAVAGPAPAASRTTPPPKTSPASAWTLEAGLGTYWMRDVGGTRPRLIASPTSWVGEGVAVSLRHDRSAPKRLHRLQVTLAAVGHFSQDAVVVSSPREADAHWHLDASYEYRRYLLRDLWIDGLDLGVGAQGLAGHAASTRLVEPSIEIGTHETDLAVSAVAAARFRRWRRLEVEAAWLSGAVISRTAATHSVDARADYRQWGGGWLEQVVLIAAAPVSARLSVAGTWSHAAQGHYASHDLFASGGQRITVGVRYGR